MVRVCSASSLGGSPAAARCFYREGCRSTSAARLECHHGLLAGLQVSHLDHAIWVPGLQEPRGLKRDVLAVAMGAELRLWKSHTVRRDWPSSVPSFLHLRDDLIAAEQIGPYAPSHERVEHTPPHPKKVREEIRMWSLMAVTLAAACAFAIASIVIGRFNANPPQPPASRRGHWDF
jgi:hypothetical protein